MPLVDIDLNANFGRKGPTAAAWKEFFRNLDARLVELKKQSDNATKICQTTQHQFDTYIQVRAEQLKHGCEPMRDMKAKIETDGDTTRNIATWAMIVAVGHIAIKGGVALEQWVTHLIHTK